MRIAFIQRQYSSFGGAERVLRDAMSEMVRRGHDVHLFAQQWAVEEDWFREVTVNQVPVLSKPSDLSRLSFALKVRKLLERETFDIVHSFDRTISQDFIAAGGGCHREWLRWKRRLSSNPLARLVPLSHLKPSEQITLWLERTGYRETPVIVAVSNRVREEILENHGLPPEQVRVIYNGVDTDLFHPRNVGRYREEFRQQHGFGEDELLLLFLGSGYTRKGLAALVRAVGILAQDQWKGRPFRLAVVGKGRPRKYVALAEQLGIGEKVRFLGPVEEPQKALAAADIFALPSVYEPFGCVYLEALATGIPVIATRVAGASEVVEGTEAGAVVDDALSSEELAEKIAPFADEQRRAVAAVAGRRIAEEQSLPRKIEELLQLYTEYANGTQET